MSDERTGTIWLQEWTPEDELFWESTGQRIAWRTLRITTANLTMAFVVWFVVSAVVVRLDEIGFDLSTTQLFWLAAIPGLAGGTLRIVHTFLIPIYGTRQVVAIASFLLLLPLVGWFFAVQNPDTPYGVLLVLAALAGLGGGNFSSFMPSTSLFFPKRLQGTALGIQAGVGNFGVSLVQFVTPWIIGFALLGSLGGSQPHVTEDGVSEIWLQNAMFVWMPIVIAFALWAWFGLKSVPVRASFREQLDIFGDKNTWLFTSLYAMAFGSFAGLSAAFPLLIKELYGDFANAPDPLRFAFLGPLVGSIMRIVAGPVSDRVGGAKVTMVAAVGLLVCAIGITSTTEPTSTDTFMWFVIWMLGLFFFSGIGNASVYKQIPMVFPARQASGVLGWTAAIAAYGPFVFAVLIAWSIAVTDIDSPNLFFYGLAVFYAINIFIDYWFYLRRNAEKPS
jgi:NNP family nitrate/nitrite transporter-like MFS transporter